MTYSTSKTSISLRTWLTPLFAPIVVLTVLGAHISAHAVVASRPEDVISEPRRATPRPGENASNLPNPADVQSQAEHNRINKSDKNTNSQNAPKRPTTLKNLSPEERKILSELYTTTLKPLTLERIAFDTKLLETHRQCVVKSATVDAFKQCDNEFLDARRENSETITQKIEDKRFEIEKKYFPEKSKPKNQNKFFN